MLLPIPTTFPAFPTVPWTPQFGVQAMVDWSNALTQVLIESQRVPLQACLAWQQAMAATQQELWDEWTCRFAGGAPIDV